MDKSVNVHQDSNRKRRDNSIDEKRSQWLSNLSLPEKEELLFELEMNLRALDRYFNLNNHSFSDYNSLLNRDFIGELRIVLAAVNRVVVLTGELLQEKTKNIFYFQRYILDKLLEDFSRDIHLKQSVKQTIPEESLHSLRIGFINLRNIISFLEHLSPEVSFTEFNSIGQLISREITSNKFFNPFESKPFLPEFDRIIAPRISTIIFSISKPELKKKTSIVYLAFFRLLHYLEYVDPFVESVEELKSLLIYFSLINSECKRLLHFLENDLLPYLIERKNVEFSVSLNISGKGAPKKLKIGRVVEAFESLAYQLSMELRNVNKRVIGDLISLGQEHMLRGRIENAKGILTNLLQQVIVFVSQEFDKRICGEDIFPDFISRKNQSVLLRRDIWLFRELMGHYEEKIETGFNQNTLRIYQEFLGKLALFIEYFKENTSILLRYDDALEFQKFFDTIESLSEADLAIVYKLESFKLSAKYFKIFLDTMLGNINNRAELHNETMNITEAQRYLKKFITD